MLSSMLGSACLLHPTAHIRPFVPADVAGRARRARPCQVRAELPALSSDAASTAQSAAENLIAGQQVSPLAIAAGLAAAGIGLGALLLNQKQSVATSDTAAAGGMAAAIQPSSRPEHAVLVFGASGKLGRQLVKQLLASGRTVVAALRDEAKRDTLSDAANGAEERLFVRAGVDITSPQTLTKELLNGVEQIAIAVGPVFGRTSDGQMGYLDDMTSERVDSEGVANVAKFAQQLPKPSTGSKLVLSMGKKDLQAWQRLDDVIMGGKSDSTLEAAADDSEATAVWRGELITEGGGFCGTRSSSQDWDLDGYDGIQLRVRGDGQTYKMNLKTAEQLDSPESTFQAQFDTQDGVWVTIRLPWHEFVPVKRAQVDRTKDAVVASQIRQFGLVLSRFEFNGSANPNCRPGPFQLQIKDGISAYKAAKPSVVLVGTAAVERNAVIGDDAEARKADIPIVQLNPGGILNHKYAGEVAVRAAGVPYTVVRSVGLTNEDVDTPFLLETHQGDRISGKISRQEVAQVAAEALNSPLATGKTFEVRRSQAEGDRKQAMTPAHFRRAFLQLTSDRLRPTVGLWPFPKVVPPPPPPSEERKQEILSDDRVKNAIARGRGSRVRTESETDAAGSLTKTRDGRKDVSPQSDQSHAAQRTSAEPSAKEWIENWKQRTH